MTYGDIEQCVSRCNSDDLILEDKNFSAVESNGYIAAHIYFRGLTEDRNQKFRWELQIWRTRDEQGNQESHRTHRYRYRDWGSTVKDDDKTLHSSE